jgi:hypothetical protein
MMCAQTKLGAPTMFSKRLHHTVLILSFIAISLSTGCFKKKTPAVTERTPSPIIGTWLAVVEGNGVGSTLLFAEDGSFVIDTESTEGVDATGRYTATSAQVTFTTENATDEACAALATYSFTVTNNLATFVPATTDTCTLRLAVLEQSFSRR